MSTFHRNVNIKKSPYRFDVLFRCNVDGQIIDVILMYIWAIILMGEKSTQLQHAFLMCF